MIAKEISIAPWVQQFVDMYQVLNKHNLHLLAEVYAAEIRFTDPLHQIEGLSALQRYFAGLYANVESLRFEIETVITAGDDAALTWVMHFTHPKLNGGQVISVSGMTHLRKGDDKIVCHRDYFDAGQMLYRHVPLLGTAINIINRRLVSA